MATVWRITTPLSASPYGSDHDPGCAADDPGGDAPALLARLAREVENVEYVKVEAPPTAPKMSAILDQTERLTVFGGLNGQFMIEEIWRGARSMMPGSDLVPELVRIWNHLKAGDGEAAWRLFTHILPLARFELQPGMGVSAQKHNLAARGVIKSACTAPRGLS